MDADHYGDWEDIDALTSNAISSQRMILVASHLLQDWERCSLSADFWARYTALSVPASNQKYGLRREDLENRVSYLLNELFENCAKFSQDSLSEVQYCSWFFSDHLVFEMRNQIHPDQKTVFAARIKELLKGDLSELYLQKMAEDPGEGMNDTGLGYLTLMEDDDIRFGFRFYPISDATTAVAIQAHVDLKEV